MKREIIISSIITVVCIGVQFGNQIDNYVWIGGIFGAIIGIFIFTLSSTKNV